MRNTLINISLLVGTIILFFGGIELALRATGLISVAPTPPGIYQQAEDPEISYELIPGATMEAFRSTITTNSLGFRGPEVDNTKPMIAFLGDSITFGYGLQDSETIPAQVDNLLPLYEVLNAAVPGYNLVQETAVYREKLYALDPEVLVVIVHPNDLHHGGGKVSVLDDEGFLRAPDWVRGAPTCDPIERGLMQLIPGKCWLDLHSAFYQAVKKVVNARSGQRSLAKNVEQEKESASPETITDEDLRIYGSQLEKLVWMLPPDLPRHLVIWPEWHLHLEARPKLTTIAENLGFRVLDLYDHFGNSPETLGWDNVHPSAQTAAEAAKIIAEQIRKGNVVEDD